MLNAVPETLLTYANMALQKESITEGEHEQILIALVELLSGTEAEVAQDSLYHLRKYKQQRARLWQMMEAKGAWPELASMATRGGPN